MFSRKSRQQTKESDYVKYTLATASALPYSEIKLKCQQVASPDSYATYARLSFLLPQLCQPLLFINQCAGNLSDCNSEKNWPLAPLLDSIHRTVKT